MKRHSGDSKPTSPASAFADDLYDVEGMQTERAPEGAVDKVEKQRLSESDVCDLFITPALIDATWDQYNQVRREVTLTPGPIIVRGDVCTRNTRRKKFADYVLSWKPGIPVAVVEAKDNNHSVSAGIQQALEYAQILQVPAAFSSNGDAFAFHDRVLRDGNTETEISLHDFPDPTALWERYRSFHGISDDQQTLAEQPYFIDSTGKEPRYYQVDAINRTVEQIAKGQKRLLLVMATGTGKTLTAFQIIWRLWKGGAAGRVLFLADRNILVDQAIANDFKPFGEKMAKVRNRKIDPSYEVHLALYQALTGPAESDKIFKSLSRDFFDLIIVDECHRGSTEEDAAWREILDYFTAATQIGMTATPRETRYASNITYFGDPIYSYSLKQGIEDGFLAPYKVIRIDIDRDVLGWRPTPGMLDDLGQELQQREYSRSDMDRVLVLNQRTKLVAHRVMQYLNATDPMAKTIIFCEDIDHAERMRQAIVNASGKLAVENSRYVMRITGDSIEGKAQLENFIDPEQRYPVVVTTSQLLTTGVDAKTCKLIVLDKTITSMTMFKQIIGRGTRVDEDNGKMYFTIIDFKKATELFRDDGFDGPPIVIYEPSESDSPLPPDNETEASGDNEDEPERTRQTKVVVSGVTSQIIFERTEHVGVDGKLVAEGYREYAREILQQEYKSLDDFTRKWNEAPRKQPIISELLEFGLALADLQRMAGTELDDYDVICYAAFDKQPTTRKSRAENVRSKNYLSKFDGSARTVLEGLLDKYEEKGVGTIEDPMVLRLKPFDQIGTPLEIIRGAFGGKASYEAAITELETYIYRQVDHE